MNRDTNLVKTKLVPSCGSLVAGYRRIGDLFASQAIAYSSTCSTHCASQDERMMQHTSRLACILRIPVLSGYPFTDHAWIINHITLMQITASINSIGITRVVPCLYMNNHRCTHAFFFHDAVRTNPRAKHVQVLASPSPCKWANAGPSSPAVGTSPRAYVTRGLD